MNPILRQYSLDRTLKFRFRLNAWFDLELEAVGGL
jgi:hypothetical protein